MNSSPALRLSAEELSEKKNAALRLFAQMPETETPRLRLRKLRMRDAGELYEWMSDAEVARYVLWEAHRSPRDTRSYLRYIRQMYRRGWPSSWGIELKESGRLIGTIGMMSWFPDHRSAEVGYSLGRAWWQRGYAAEALEAVLRLLFERAELNRVEAMCDVRNRRSARVMEKCGMTREGLLRQRVINKGETIDVLMYSILRAEYGRRRNDA